MADTSVAPPAAPGPRRPRSPGWGADALRRARRLAWPLDVAIGGALLALVWAVLQTPLGRELEYKTFDAGTTLAAPYRVASPIVIVAIDEPSFQQLGLRWPFPRRLHGELVDRLAQDGATAIAFDIQFSEPGNADDDARLAAAIGRARNVVLARSREAAETANTRLLVVADPLPELLAAGAVAGDVGVDPDADNTVRIVPPMPDAFARVVASRASAHGPPPAAAGPQLIRYAGPRGTFETVHYYQAVTPGLLPPGYFRDKIALVGLTVLASPEPQRKDLFNSPFIESERRQMPGIVIHANVLANLLEGRPLRPAPQAADLLVMLVAALAVGVAGRRGTPLSAAAVLAAVAAAILAASYALFAHGSVWLSPLMPLLAATAVYFGGTAVSFLVERRRVQETRRAFAQYVPPEVVQRLADHPELLELGGETRELTLLFADLANFTTIAEPLPPHDVVALLTEYLDAMSVVIHRHGGTVDKYIGDGIMAFWGAPLPDDRHALHAMRAALDMQQAFAAIAQRHATQGMPGLAMRIGIHTGSVIVGNVGSHARFAYTAIGDAVNLASRLEGANKAYGTRILVSESTVRQLPADIGLRPVDAVIVKGRREAVTAYTPCDDPALVAATTAALDAYRRGGCAASAALWRELLERHPGDGVAAAFVARCAGAVPDASASQP